MKSGHQDGKTEPASHATGWDFGLGNTSFNMGNWRGESLRQDVRWKFGMRSVNNVN